MVEMLMHAVKNINAKILKTDIAALVCSCTREDQRSPPRETRSMTSTSTAPIDGRMHQWTSHRPTRLHLQAQQKTAACFAAGAVKSTWRTASQTIPPASAWHG
eukprot:256235-Pyramimonas_sp.AAC.1